jgi:ankyrin repeat protein
MVEMLLSKGADINPKGQTPLREAAAEGHLDVCATLLAKKADVNARTNDGHTPLFFAAIYGHHKVAAFLLSRGAEKDIFSAAALGDVEFVEKQIRENPKLLDSTNRYRPPTLLHTAAKFGRSKVVKLLVDRKLDPNSLASGISPIHLAAEMGHAEVLGILLANGGRCNITDRDGNTPLHLAAKRDRLAAVGILLKNKADPNSKNKRLETPLHFAVSSSANAKVLETLLTHGADPNAKDASDTSPFGLARYNRNSKEILPLLQKYGAKE